MKKATAKDLRQKTSALLEDVRRGQEILITFRSRPIAALVPLKRVENKAFNSVGFGLWKGREDLRKVDKWLADLRAPRIKR